jgi:hypothetical protein
LSKTFGGAVTLNRATWQPNFLMVDTTNGSENHLSLKLIPNGLPN